MKLLFVSRTYPPVTGGMETYSRNFYSSINKHLDAKLRANLHGKLGLPWFLLTTIIWLIFHARQYDRIHFGDGVLAPIALWTSWISNVKTSCTIHALDITYSNPVYQLLVPYSLKKLDNVICVSHYTKRECLRRGIPEKLCIVIPNALVLSELPIAEKILQERLRTKLHLDNQKVLLSVGRLIRRKGLAWFISNVMSVLPENYILLIAGEGPDRKEIELSILNHQMAGRVHLLGLVDEKTKASLYGLADLFVMPNIQIPGDAEGFGISIIEAAAYGTPCIAADLEGISDAVIQGVTGNLVSSQDANSFVNAIRSAQFNRDSVIDACRQTYNWADVIYQYLEVFGSK